MSDSQAEVRATEQPMLKLQYMQISWIDHASHSADIKKNFMSGFVQTLTLNVSGAEVKEAGVRD